MNMRTRFSLVGAAVFACAALATAASAHLMIAQRGTLKFGRGGAFFVVSVPVSAFSGVDDDGDGLLRVKELSAHGPAIEAAVRDGFVLESEGEGQTRIDGLLLNLAHSHGDPNKPADQVVAMGRFSVTEGDEALTLMTTLFGEAPSEHRLELAITRGESKEAAILTPDMPLHRLFERK